MKKPQATPEEEEKMRAASQAANEAAEALARGEKPRKKERGESAESDFREDAELGGQHTPRKGWTFTEEINGTTWRLAPVDSGTYNRFLKTTAEVDKSKNKLVRAGVKLQARKNVLDNRFATAAAAEASGTEEIDESTDEVEALIEALEEEIQANQQQQAEIMLAPLEAMRAVVEYCLRDWAREDDVPLNATTRAALDSTRVNQLATACIERHVAGVSSAQFRR